MPGKKPHLNALINGIFALGLLFIMASVAGLFATWLLVDRVGNSAETIRSDGLLPAAEGPSPAFSRPESESTLSALE